MRIFILLLLFSALVVAECKPGKKAPPTTTQTQSGSGAEEDDSKSDSHHTLPPPTPAEKVTAALKATGLAQDLNKLPTTIADFASNLTKLQADAAETATLFATLQAYLSTLSGKPQSDLKSAITALESKIQQIQQQLTPQEAFEQLLLTADKNADTTKPAGAIVQYTSTLTTTVDLQVAYKLSAATQSYVVSLANGQLKNELSAANQQLTQQLGNLEKEKKKKEKEEKEKKEKEEKEEREQQQQKNIKQRLNNTLQSFQNQPQQEGRLSTTKALLQELKNYPKKDNDMSTQERELTLLVQEREQELLHPADGPDRSTFQDTLFWEFFDSFPQAVAAEKKVFLATDFSLQVTKQEKGPMPGAFADPGKNKIFVNEKFIAQNLKGTKTQEELRTNYSYLLSVYLHELQHIQYNRENDEEIKKAAEDLKFLSTPTQNAAIQLNPIRELESSSDIFGITVNDLFARPYRLAKLESPDTKKYKPFTANRLAQNSTYEVSTLAKKVVATMLYYSFQDEAQAFEFQRKVLESYENNDKKKLFCHKDILFLQKHDSIDIKTFIKSKEASFKTYLSNYFESHFLLKALQEVSDEVLNDETIYGWLRFQLFRAYCEKKAGGIPNLHELEKAAGVNQIFFVKPKSTPPQDKYSLWGGQLLRLQTYYIQDSKKNIKIKTRPTIEELADNYIEALQIEALKKE